jgi:hypothetical protein
MFLQNYNFLAISDKIFFIFDNQTKLTMQIVPLGSKILVRDIPQQEKKTASGIVLINEDYYKRVTIIDISPQSAISEYIKIGYTCLCERTGVELEPGLFLCNESNIVSILPE